MVGTALKPSRQTLPGSAWLTPNDQAGFETRVQRYRLPSRETRCPGQGSVPLCLNRRNEILVHKPSLPGIHDFGAFLDVSDHRHRSLTHTSILEHDNANQMGDWGYDGLS